MGKKIKKNSFSLSKVGSKKEKKRKEQLNKLLMNLSKFNGWKQEEKC